MLPDLTLPASLMLLLGALRPCFTRRSFETFCGLAAGLCGQVRRRTVAGMLLGAGLAGIWPHDRAHRFFARARWDIDELGLAVARLVVALLVPEGEPVTVAVDDSVSCRTGRRVHGAAWQHDGSSPSKNKLSFGNCFVTAGIVVTLPFCTRPVCLPVLARLNIPAPGAWRRKNTARRHRHIRYADIACLWYGSLHRIPARLIISRDKDGDLALITTDLATPAPALIERYAGRWSIEQAFHDIRQVLGGGEARNRARAAVERTVPFTMLIHTLIVIWYTRHGHDHRDITARRTAQPWYKTKTEPSFEDMLIKLRRVLITAQISRTRSTPPTPQETQAVLTAWHAAAA